MLKILNQWALLACVSFSTTTFSADFIVIGDMPYGRGDKVEEGYRHLISSINSEDSAFVVHLGDIKSGSTLCDDQMYVKQKVFFSLFERPLVYTPGDNEWTDCHRRSNGGYDPLERLGRLREVLFDEPYFYQNSSLGLNSQGVISNEFSEFVENQMWVSSKTLFLTLHVVGSNNNMEPGTRFGELEFMRRERANKNWINEGFDRLASEDILEAVVIFHGDPFIDWMTPSPSLMFSGFSEVIGSELMGRVRNTDKKVLMIHGDTHNYRWDSEFYSDQLRNNNLTRLVVPGAGDMRAVRVSVQRSSKEYFRHQLIE